MRISVDERDRGFQTLLQWGGPSALITVTLDGREVFSCITADEELGEVKAVVLREDGSPEIDGDDFRTEWRRGKVKIDMPQVLFG